jgi:hypothetical protein
MEETTVDDRTRKLAGWVIAAAGAIIAILGALAGPIGLGDDDFGPLQIAAVIIGVVVAAAGVVLTRWSPSVGGATTASTSEATTAGPTEATTAGPTDATTPSPTEATTPSPTEP